jgi:hypothetical protein
MMKNLLGKKKENTDSNNDEEVQKLREKFNDIVNSPTENPQTNTQQQPTQTPINQTTQNPNPQNNQEQFKYVDPEKAEENERITNLIMQQIKELIEIDNNLNDKNKELENKISENSNTLSTTKEIVQQFNSRLELIEKNMEKFMGLYEVVTNRFNPFVSEEEPKNQQNPNVNNSQNIQTNQPAINKPNKQENQIKPIREEKLENPIKKEIIQPQKTADLQIQEEISEIIHESGIDTKLDNEKQAIIKEELNSAIELAGDKAKNKIAKEEITKDVAKMVSEKLKKELEEHVKISNEELKNAMKEMLLQTVSHLKENPTQAFQEQTPNQTQTNQQLPQAQTEQQPTTTKETNQQIPNQTPVQETNKQATSDTNSNNAQQNQNSTLHEEVHPDFHFNLADGTPIKSIQGLKDSLNTMDDNSFNQHVNDEKNDFAEWIRIVYKNNELADKLNQEKTREGIKNILNSI